MPLVLFEKIVFHLEITFSFAEKIYFNVQCIFTDFLKCDTVFS